MAITLTELQAKLMLIDEISLMEILEITSEDIANRFIDRIETKYDQLITEFEADELDPGSGFEEGWWHEQDMNDELYTDEDEQ